jgi:hypothetical protein
VPVKDEVHVARGTERYARFWRVRSRLAEVTKLQLELIDELGRSLLEPYPPDRPLPPPVKRGPTPKGAKNRGSRTRG